MNKIDLKTSGTLLIVFGSFILLLAVIYKENNIKDLKLIKGNLTSIRQKKILKSKKSTLIKLDNFSKKEFNLGEKFDIETLQKLIDKDTIPVKIELYVAKNFYKESKSLIPAFYGLTANNLNLKTNKDGLETNKKNKRGMLFAGLIILLMGLSLKLKPTK